jgi:hypothetical protein
MLTPPTNTNSVDDEAQVRLFVQREYDRAMEKFRAAVVIIRNRHSTNIAIINAKHALYAAANEGTVSAFREAAKLFEGTRTSNHYISDGKKLLFDAVKICEKADMSLRRYNGAAADNGAAAAPSAVKAEPAAPALDVTRALLSAPAQLSVLDKTNRVVLSGAAPAPAQAVAGSAAAFDVAFKQSAFRESLAFFRSFCEPPANLAQATAPAADTDKKRPVEVIDLVSSDDEQPPPKKAPPAGGVAQASNGAGKAPKSPEEQVTDACRMGDRPSDDKVVYAADFEGEWTDKVLDMMKKLTKHGLYDWKQMNGYAHDELRTLPEEVALECLQQFLNHENYIEDTNQFLIDHAQELRAVYGIEQPVEIFQKHADQAKADDDTESDNGAGPAP